MRFYPFLFYFGFQFLNDEGFIFRLNSSIYGDGTRETWRWFHFQKFSINCHWIILSEVVFFFFEFYLLFWNGVVVPLEQNAFKGSILLWIFRLFFSFKQYDRFIAFDDSRPNCSFYSDEDVIPRDHLGFNVGFEELIHGFIGICFEFVVESH